MKFRHAMIVLSAALPVCVVLRALQLIFTIDSSTGFIKQSYNTMAVAITIIVCVAVAVVSALAIAVDKVKTKPQAPKPVLAVACLLVSGMFVFNTVANIYKIIETAFWQETLTQNIINAFNSVAWYDSVLLILSVLSALCFAAYGLKNIYDYNMSIALVVPVLYYIVKLISIFVSTSSLALITENVFLIFTNCVLLWFIFEFASFENQMGDTNKKPKKLFASGLAAVMLCAMTSLPEFIRMICDKTLVSGDAVSEASLNLAVGIFVLIYIMSSFCGSQDTALPTSKHSA